ncbi:hypothetical protein [Sulfurimonas sp.]
MLREKNILALLDYIKIDSYTVTCYFKCPQTNKSIVSVVPFEPYEGKIELSYKDILLHPLKSYKIYYHTPIMIYGNKNENTIVYKAFEKVSNKFKWNEQKNKYICV